MLTYRQYLSELFDAKVPYRWIGTGDPYERRATFVVGDDTYVVTLDAGVEADVSQKATPWVVSFYLQEPNGSENYMLTRQHQDVVFEVGAAVMHIVTDFIKKYRPASVEFSAEEEERIPVYRKILPLLARRTGYVMDRQAESPDIFRVLRPGFTPQRRD